MARKRGNGGGAGGGSAASKRRRAEGGETEDIQEEGEEEEEDNDEPFRSGTPEGWEPLPGDIGDGIPWQLPTLEEVSEELVERRRRRLLETLG